MPNYDNHKDVVDLLIKAQDNDEESRAHAKEAARFVNTRNGQWEDEWWNKSSGKPRYQFDVTTNTANIVANELSRADFNISVAPAGGDATKEIARTYEGMIRNIENLSKASHIFNTSARKMIKTGIDGWEVVQKYVDDDSFDQDLIVKPINNFVDRVWFDHAFEDQDASDARHCFKLSAVPSEVFEEKYGRQGRSLPAPSKLRAYSSKDVVVAGQLYFYKDTDRELALMSNGAVYAVDDKFKSIKDDLASVGVFVKKTRNRPSRTVYLRKFDAHGWLDEGQESVFGMLPIVPTFGNFEIFEDNVVYFGMIEKMMDPQRVMNYTLSREVEEGALAPRAKVWMSKQHVGDDEDIKRQLETMNTNTDPVQFWNPVDGLPAPYEMGGAKINPGLRVVSETMKGLLLSTSGQFSSAQGDNPGLQSGVAIDSLQDKSDTSSAHYALAQEVAIARTGLIITDAIPRMYDTPRMERVINEDGSFEMVSLYDQVPDQETGNMVDIRDLGKGIYDVTCHAGPAFKNRQQETVAGITSIGSIDPSFVQLGGDVLANNFDSPGMSQLAERKRMQLIQSGAIPQSQLTDEEKQEIEMQAQQPKEPDAMMVAAQAEMEKAQAQKDKNELDFMEKQLRLSKQEQEFERKSWEEERKRAEFEHKREMDMFKAGHVEAQTEGQLIDNEINLEKLREMPTEELLKIYAAGNR